MRRWFTIRKSISIFCFIDRPKVKNHMSISSYLMKSIWQNSTLNFYKQHSIKQQSMAISLHYVFISVYTYVYLKSQSCLMVIDQSFPPKKGTRQDISLLSLLFDMVLQILANSDKRKKFREIMNLEKKQEGNCHCQHVIWVNIWKTQQNLLKNYSKKRIR